MATNVTLTYKDSYWVKPYWLRIEFNKHTAMFNAMKNGFGMWMTGECMLGTEDHMEECGIETFRFDTNRDCLYVEIIAERWTDSASFIECARKTLRMFPTNESGLAYFKVSDANAANGTKYHIGVNTTSTEYHVILPTVPFTIAPFQPVVSVEGQEIRTYEYSCTSRTEPYKQVLNQYLLPGKSGIRLFLSDIQMQLVRGIERSYQNLSGEYLDYPVEDGSSFSTTFSGAQIRVYNESYNVQAAFSADFADSMECVLGPAMFVQSGTFSIEATITDSRGMTAVVDCGTVSITPYAKPRIDGLTAQRCDHNGEAAEEGTGILIGGNAVYDTTLAGNGITTELFLSGTKRTQGSTTDLSVLSILDADNLPDADQTCQLGLSYNGFIRVTDLVGEVVEQEFRIPRAYIFMRWDAARNRFGFGVYPAYDNSVALGDDWTLYVDNIESRSICIRNDDQSDDIGFRAGQVTLKPQTVCELLNTDDVPGNTITVTLQEPKAGLAAIYEFIAHLGVGGSVILPENVKVPALTQMHERNDYHVRIVNNYAVVSQISDPAIIWLYDYTADDPECTINSGGWALGENGLYYRTQYVAIDPNTKVMNIGWNASSSYPAACSTMNKLLDFDALQKAGFRSINVMMYGSYTSSNNHDHVIVGTKALTTSGNYSAANMTAAYGTYVEFHRQCVTEPSVMQLTIDDIMSAGVHKGYISLRRYNTYNGSVSAYFSYVQKVWIE